MKTITTGINKLKRDRTRAAHPSCILSLSIIVVKNKKFYYIYGTSFYAASTEALGKLSTEWIGTNSTKIVIVLTLRLVEAAFFFTTHRLLSTLIIHSTNACVFRTAPFCYVDALNGSVHQLYLFSLRCV